MVLADPALVGVLGLRMGDNALILGQRLSEWCGHAPVLEEDIATANIALDLIGQASNWLKLAGEVEGGGRSADDLAFLRDAREFTNVLLVEQPDPDFAHTLMRQYLFDSWHAEMLDRLVDSTEARIAEVAAKSAKEAAYHRRRSADLIVRLGDGSEESHARMQAALDALYPFAGELDQPDDCDKALAAAAIAPDLGELAGEVASARTIVFGRAGLSVPTDVPVRSGGKSGLHSEALGYLLAEMQILQRSHPGAKW